MRYFISTVILVMVLVGFFLLPEGRYRTFGKSQWALKIVMAIPLIVSSMGHFFRTGIFASIVPPVFSHPDFWVVLTGVFELAGAIGLILPRTAKPAAIGLALLMIAVFSANIYGANQIVGGIHMPGVPVRLAMQAIYVILLLVAGFGIPGGRQSKVAVGA